MLFRCRAEFVYLLKEVPRELRAILHQARQGRMTIGSKGRFVVDFTVAFLNQGGIIHRRREAVETDPAVRGSDADELRPGAVRVPVGGEEEVVRRMPTW